MENVKSMFCRDLTIHITEDIAELWFVKSKTAFFLPVFDNSSIRLFAPIFFLCKWRLLECEGNT